MGSMLAWIFLTVVALAALLTGERTARPLLVWVFKPLASVGFIGAAIANGAFDTGYGNAVFMALVWSLIGDVLLIPRDSRPSFMFGLVGFLMAHVGYVVAFTLLGVAIPWLAISGALLIGPAFYTFRWMRPHLPRGMAGPVALYVLVITVMVASAVATWPSAGKPVVLLAAGLFYLSDLAVARQRFVAPGFVNRAVGLPLYYAAQLLFAWSVTPAG